MNTTQHLFSRHSVGHLHHEDMFQFPFPAPSQPAQVSMNPNIPNTVLQQQQQVASKVVLPPRPPVNPLVNAFLPTTGIATGLGPLELAAAAATTAPSATPWTTSLQHQQHQQQQLLLNLLLSQQMMAPTELHPNPNTTNNNALQLLNLWRLFLSTPSNTATILPPTIISPEMKPENQAAALLLGRQSELLLPSSQPLLNTNFCQQQPQKLAPPSSTFLATSTHLLNELQRKLSLEYLLRVGLMANTSTTATTTTPSNTNTNNLQTCPMENLLLSSNTSEQPIRRDNGVKTEPMKKCAVMPHAMYPGNPTERNSPTSSSTPNGTLPGVLQCPTVLHSPNKSQHSMLLESSTERGLVSPTTSSGGYGPSGLLETDCSQHSQAGEEYCFVTSSSQCSTSGNNNKDKDTSIGSTATTKKSTRRNRSTGFQEGVTIGYTYETFFQSDGRSRKRHDLMAASSSQASSTTTALGPCPLPTPSSSSSPQPEQNGPLSSTVSISSKPARRFRCTECGRDYATSSNLSRHKQIHRSPDSQAAKSCTECGKKYVSMPALAMHMKTHSMRYKCDVCGQRFARDWLLAGHMRTHTGEKPYGCAHCHKAFADRSNLRAHMQTHSEAKRFQCAQCGKKFALKAYLNKHQESAHGAAPPGSSSGSHHHNHHLSISSATSQHSSCADSISFQQQHSHQATLSPAVFGLVPDSATVAAHTL